jgi:hypothetical protein
MFFFKKKILKTKKKPDRQTDRTGRVTGFFPIFNGFRGFLPALSRTVSAH